MIHDCQFGMGCNFGGTLRRVFSGNLCFGLTIVRDCSTLVLSQPQECALMNLLAVFSLKLHLNHHFAYTISLVNRFRSMADRGA